MNALLEETAQELGFKTLEDFLMTKLIEELEKKNKNYENQILNYENKYKMGFLDFKVKYLTVPHKEDFEKEEEGAEWEWNLFAIESTKKKIESLKNARNH